MDLAQLVREGRKKKSLSESDLGRLIKPRNPGRGVEYVRSIESGTMSFPPMWALGIIAEALDLGRAEIFAALKTEFGKQDRPLDRLEVEIRNPDGWCRYEILPEGTTPAEAVNVMRGYAADGALRCRMMISNLKEITVEGGGAVRERYRFPAGCGLRVQNGFLVPPDIGIDKR